MARDQDIRANTCPDQGEAAEGIEPSYRALQAWYSAGEVPGQPGRIYPIRGSSERKVSGPRGLGDRNQALA